MAHFAKLGVGNIVNRVEVVSNDIAVNEQAGVDFLNNLYKTRDVWKQTSYNGNMRKNFAAIGYTYDESRDAFISPQPYPSWILDEDTCIWKAPIEVPSDDKHYFWDESSKSWNEFKYT
tara:strand:- start:776 stop:1129 length:354 start_codon:yes stop_codon:yes gene_type:complete